MRLFRGFFLLFLLQLSLISCHCSQKIVNGNDKFYHSLPIDGTNRDFIIDLPSDYDCSIDYPVVIAFHGTSQLNEKAWDDWGWKEKGEDEDVITVYPQAMEYTFTSNLELKTKWDDGQLSDPSNPLDLNPIGQNIYDDIAFIDAMIAFIKIAYSTDLDRYYATGFSNGAGFVWRLAIERSDLFTAYGPHAGLINVTGSPSAFKPIYLSAGASEPVIIALNGNNPVPFNATDIISVIQGFVIDPSLNTMDMQDISTKITENDDQVIVLWDQPNVVGENQFLKLVLWADTAHVYPSNLNPFSNPNGYHLVDTYWEFFESLQ